MIRLNRSAFSLLELIVVMAIVNILLGLLLSAVQQVRARAFKLKCQNNLRQIGLALHQYHDAYEHFPLSHTPRDHPTESILGWPARILTYMDQANLWQDSRSAYQQQLYPLSGPPHPAGVVLPFYICPLDDRLVTPLVFDGFKDGMPVQTDVAFLSYMGVSGLSRKQSDGAMPAKAKTNIVSTLDGTTNTLFIGERPVDSTLHYGWWYAGIGDDLHGTIDFTLGVREVRGFSFAHLICPKGPYRFEKGYLRDPCSVFHFWSLHSGGTHFLFMDGRVQFIRYEAEPLLPALASRMGGEVVELSD